jgi:hypothetical protein
MRLGARPIDAHGARLIIDRKAADFRVPARGIQVLHLRPERFFESASRDPDVRFSLETGYMQDIAEELRDPVLVSVEERVVFTCPPLVPKVLSGEPPEIHCAFVEGAFMRKLFRFFVPATHDGGQPWEAVEQVREIMQRHFSLQLVVTETVLSEAA